MRSTVVGLVTPHVLNIIDLAKKAESGVNVDWYLRDAVAKSVDDLSHQYNSRELLSAYIHGLGAAADESGRFRKPYVDALKTAALMAEQRLKDV